MSVCADGVVLRARRFWKKPSREKINALRQRWLLLGSILSRARRLLVPLRLPLGLWWIAREDNLSELLLAGAFEQSEIAFVRRFLQPGMVVLDIGAHQGLYTMLASKCVRPRGRVVAFEPSPRERRALRLHAWLNLCQNVTIEPFAIGNEDAHADLFVVQGAQTGCNSLRPPNVLSETRPVSVRVIRLDDWMAREKLERVDFIKLDVEGAELDALKGADRLLTRRPRPAILAEVQDVRTEPWGYRAKEIIRHLSKRGFRWFALSMDGSLDELDLSLDAYDGNFVAWPEESDCVPFQADRHTTVQPQVPGSDELPPPGVNACR